MTKQLCLYSYKSLFFTLVFLMLGYVEAFGQCPIVTSPTQTFCDIQAPIIGNLIATNTGNGIRWYATANSTNALSPATGLLNGEDYYADDNSGTCGIRQRVDVVIYSAPIGLNFQGVCVDNPMEATIADLVASGNDVRWYNVPNGGVALAPSTILTDNTIYYADQSNPITGCRTSRLSVFVNVGVVPVPTGNAIQEFCFDQQPVPTIADLNASGTNNWYNTISSALPLDPSTPLVDGASYFATTVDPPCESDERLEVLVVFNSPNDPGTSGTIEVCETDVVTTQTVNLFDGLTGTPMTGGIWTGPFPTTNGSLGTVNITTMTVSGSPYLFTYTVDVSNGCSEASATVAVNIIPPPDAGTSGAVTFCGNGSPTDLFDYLEGTPDPNGSWSPQLASGTGIFNPNVDPPGTYTYTVLGTGPCELTTSEVVVNILPPPNAGIGTDVNFCENAGPLNLFDSLGGTPDAGGTWTPTLASGTGFFDPAIDPAGPYTYTVTGIAPCENATATVNITITLPPNAGTGTDVNFCGNATPFNLFDSLSGTPDAGGTWTPTLASGTGFFDPAVDPAGSYTYTVTGIAPCENATAIVNITITPPPNAGIGTTVNFCGNATPVNLFDSLGGTPDAGGTWTPTLASGSGFFDPAVDPAGAYIYTVMGIPPCENATSVVTISIITPQNAGVGADVNFCGNAAPIDLFDSLTGTPESGGTWTPALASGTGFFDPAVDPIGAYTYTVTGIAPCENATATINIIVTPPPNAGIGTDVTFCGNATPVNLFDSLNGSPDAGGTWTPALASGTGLFDPAVDSAGSYTYTVTGIAPCVNATAVINITITQPPNAGIGTTVTFCGNATPINLFDSLSGTPDAGGTWTPALASGTGLFDPSVDPFGDYTYTVTGVAPCANATAVVTIILALPPDAGLNGTVTVCESGIPINLFDYLNGTPESGGEWTPALASGTGIFNPLVDAPGLYTYIVTASNTCTASATVTVSFVLEPNSGTGGTVAFCSNGSPMDLFNSLTGTPDAGGTWTPQLASGTGVFDPSVDTAGVYTYEVFATDPCRGSSSTMVNVIINEAPDATGALLSVESVCLGSQSTATLSNATQLLNGTYTITYSLSGANTSQNNSIAVTITGGSASFSIPETLLANPGINTMTINQLIAVSTQCGADVSGIASAQFEVFDAPTPTLVTDGNIFCSEDNATIQHLTSNIIETQNITWYDAPINGTMYQSSDPLEDGVTYYAALTTSEGCFSFARLAVTVSIDRCEPLELIIPDGFSPNTDGTNDTFDIVNIRQLYPNFTLEIFNRYGNVLYKGNRDTPNWDGTAKEGSGFGNSVLPVGVYFYILEFNDNAREPIQGRVYLSR